MRLIRPSQFVAKLLTGRENTALSTIMWENRRRFWARLLMALIRLLDKDHFKIYETDPRFHPDRYCGACDERINSLDGEDWQDLEVCPTCGGPLGEISV